MTYEDLKRVWSSALPPKTLAGRLAALDQIVRPTFEDEHGNAVPGEPLIDLTPAQYLELLNSAET